ERSAELTGRDTEDAANAIRIADGDLRVRLLVEPGRGVNGRAFDEDGLHGVDGSRAFFANSRVDRSHYGAIQPSAQPIGGVGRHRPTSRTGSDHEFRVGLPNEPKSRTRGQTVPAR